MKLVKSEAGQKVLKDRSVPLSPRQRAAFILFDGSKTVDQVLAATNAVGVTRDDVDYLLQLGLLELPSGAAAPDLAPAAAAPVAAAPVAAPPSRPKPQEQPEAAAPAGERTPQERYQAAYPIATKLTAGMGLRGFRLNLAVEQAMNYQQLCEVAPRIKDAVPPGAYLELHRALYG
ncbi:hypothetical protein [Ramlibacter algicola]|uniref:Uncharacterized protein n=1 Tax=Ramlibacter algicola TaxID=2795217 RepID=A0A934Q148_9BURK|nr:hypothetical protein [Ramlibacter algicola]MBK0394265.1 hypothetical protein [Ramlibacter algicola]